MMRCRNCGSTYVGRDAWVTWNQSTERWDVAAVYDDAQCLECDSDRIEDVDPEPPEYYGEPEESARERDARLLKNLP